MKTEFALRRSDFALHGQFGLRLIESSVLNGTEPTDDRQSIKLMSGSKKPMITVFAILLVVSAALLLNQRKSEELLRNWTAPLSIEARGTIDGWQFTYAGPDGIPGTDDDVHSFRTLPLPVGVDTRIELYTQDYVYVFSCPELQVKEIAVPDLDSSVEFAVGESGLKDLEMDPMCGFLLPPGETMGQIEGMSEREFDRWFNSRINKQESNTREFNAHRDRADRKPADK